MNAKNLAIKTAPDQLTPIGPSCINKLSARVNNIQGELANHKVDPNTHQNLIVSTDNLKLDDHASVFLVFVERDYWTQDNLNAWLNTYGAAMPHSAAYAIADTGVDAQYKLRALLAKCPTNSARIIIGPDGAGFYPQLFSTMPYVVLESYDYINNKDTLDWRGSVPVWAEYEQLPGSFYMYGYNVFEFWGVKFEQQSLMLGARACGIARNCVFSNGASHSQLFECWSSCAFTTARCTFNILPNTMNVVKQLFNIREQSLMVFEAENKIAGIENCHGRLFQSLRQSCYVMDVRMTFEGTPAEDMQPYYLIENSCLSSGGLAIPGPVAGHIDASSVVS